MLQIGCGEVSLAFATLLGGTDIEVLASRLPSRLLCVINYPFVLGCAGAYVVEDRQVFNGVMACKILASV